MALVLTDTQQAPIHIPLLDANGQETTVYRAGSVTFTSPSCVSIISDPAFPGSDAHKLVKALSVGSGQIVVKADTEPTGATTNFISSPPLDVTVTAGKLASIGPLEPGTPVAQS